MTGDVGDILDELGRRGVVQAMVEGGATVAGAFHRAGAVDRYVAYLAPALVGGQDAPGWFRGPGAATISEVWRGRIVTVRTVGPDLRVELAPCSPG
jgi:diaminohydroxyphosphoribosylaminopyrimidine deaminase/5-amino-6-(5-phosphoribosylamino)uracil reductase